MLVSHQVRVLKRLYIMPVVCLDPTLCRESEYQFIFKDLI